jgi:hypothetical protein
VPHGPLSAVYLKEKKGLELGEPLTCLLPNNSHSFYKERTQNREQKNPHNCPETYCLTSAPYVPPHMKDECALFESKMG